MRSASDLINEINTLPKGKLYLKTINGKQYFYHQYFDNGKRVSKIVKREDASSYASKINRRINLETELKELKQKEKSVVLSKNAKALTGQIMAGNIPVATFNKGILISINEALAPLIIKRTHSIELFLKYRTIDNSRVNSRLLKKALNIVEEKETDIPLCSYALSVGDNYWFKPRNSKLIYKDVILNSDLCFDIALKGDTSIFPAKTKITPELTTTGSYEKGWKLIDNEWWLYKSGTEAEIFSELFCYEFSKLIKLPSAQYEYDGGYIRSKNFATSYNFEPIVAVVGENDNYGTVFPLIYKISKDIAMQYVKLITFDAVVNNVDRHNENYGLLRDKRTGTIISLAPNFDNNIALISRGTLLNANPKKDGLIMSLIKFLNQNEFAYKLFKTIELPNITSKNILDIINSIPIKISSEKKDNIVTAIVNRYNYLKTYKK